MIDVSFEEITARLNQMRLPPVKLVVGIALGGIVPAGLIAYSMGSDMELVHFNYRDEDNNPRHPRPVLTNDFEAPKNVSSVLLVDDVSISGKTMDSAREIFKHCKVSTFVLKGKADYVLFPEMDSCVNWPWQQLQKA